MKIDGLCTIAAYGNMMANTFISMIQLLLKPQEQKALKKKFKILAKIFVAFGNKLRDYDNLSYKI